MIAGTYLLYKQGKPLGQKVIFDKNGKVSGLENYTTYEICFSGDCVEATEKQSNMITFSTLAKVSITYAFILNKKNKTIDLYTLGDPIRDVDGQMLKGGRAIKGKIFELKGE